MSESYVRRQGSPGAGAGCEKADAGFFANPALTYESITPMTLGRLDPKFIVI
jgi:hypothetical protein